MTKLCFFVVNFFLLKKKTTFVQETSEMGKENVWRACQQISAERGYKKRSPTYSCILNPNGALAFRRTWIVARQPNMPRHDTRLQTPSFKWTRMRNERLFSIIFCCHGPLFSRFSFHSFIGKHSVHLRHCSWLSFERMQNEQKKKSSKKRIV